VGFANLKIAAYNDAPVVEDPWGLIVDRWAFSDHLAIERHKGKCVTYQSDGSVWRIIASHGLLPLRNI